MSQGSDQSVPHATPAAQARSAWQERILAACATLPVATAVATQHTAGDAGPGDVTVLAFLDGVTVPPTLTPRQRQQVAARLMAWFDGLGESVRVGVVERMAQVVAARPRTLADLADLGGTTPFARTGLDHLAERDPVRAVLLAIRAALQGIADVPWPVRACFAPLAPGVRPRWPRDGAASQAWLLYLQVLWRFPPTATAGADLCLAVPPEHLRRSTPPLQLWVVRRGQVLTMGAELTEVAATGQLRLAGGWQQPLPPAAWRIAAQLAQRLSWAVAHG